MQYGLGICGFGHLAASARSFAAATGVGGWEWHCPGRGGRGIHIQGGSSSSRSCPLEAGAWKGTSSYSRRQLCCQRSLRHEWVRLDTDAGAQAEAQRPEASAASTAAHQWCQRSWPGARRSGARGSPRGGQATGQGVAAWLALRPGRGGSKALCRGPGPQWPAAGGCRRSRRRGAQRPGGPAREAPSARGAGG